MPGMRRSITTCPSGPLAGRRVSRYPQGMDTQEPEEHALDRSPELMSAGNTALVVVDVQEKLIGAIAEGRRVVWNVRRLIDGAKVLGVPVVGTEQYPRGLGPTVPELAERLGPLPSKLTFSGGGCPEVFARLRARASTISWCAASRRTCASSRRSSTFWPTAGGSSWRSTRWARATSSTARPPFAAWSPPARRSPRPNPPCSNGARSPARPSSNKSAAWSGKKGRRGRRRTGVWLPRMSESLPE